MKNRFGWRDKQPDEEKEPAKEPPHKYSPEEIALAIKIARGE